MDFLTTKEIAELLKVHIITIRRYINSGKLSATFLGKEFRVKRSDFEEFIKKRQVRKS